MENAIRENLARIQEQIAKAAAATGRAAHEIRLIGVTKYVSAEAARILFEAGCPDLGESRPQELWSKARALRDLPVRWHQIGHLQRNKVTRTLPLVEWIHSGDSLRLLQAIDAEAAELQLRPRVLLEVNVTGEAAKHGFLPEELRRELPTIAELRHLEIQGLMAMASLAGGRTQARRDFAAVRALRELLQNDCPPNIRLSELSIGMSGDFEEAIIEGSTMVRVGSALWEGLP